MEEYKGIYYGDESERKFFEGGAHFKYIKLYKALEKIAKERISLEKEQEIYIHRKNNLSNYLKGKISNDKKSRNIQSYLDSNKMSCNTQLMNNNNLNCTFNIKQHEVNLSVNNNIKNKLKKNFSIKNQKNMIISRNKDTTLLFKGKPNTILKEGAQDKLFVKKNNLISTSIEQSNKEQNNFMISTNLKRSVPDLNYLNNLDRKINNYFAKKSNNNIKKKVNSRNYVPGLIKNISCFEENKLCIKTERLNLIDEEKELEENTKQSLDGNFKSQYNFNNKNGYTNSIGVVRKTQKKIKNNGMEENNKNKKERINSNIISEINKDMIKRYSNPKIEKKEKENKINKKKNAKQNFNMNNNNNAFIKKINFNNEFMRIINEQNKANKIKINSNNYTNTNNNKVENDKNVNKNNINQLSLNQLSFNNKLKPKSRNFNQIDVSFQTKKPIINKDYNILNSTRNKNMDDFKNMFKTMAQMRNKNQANPGTQNLIYQSLNNFVKMNSQKKQNKNLNANFNTKKIKLVKPYKQNKINNNISFKNDINKIVGKNINHSNNDDFKNKNLSSNKKTAIGVYIKPKQSQYSLKKNGCINNVNIDKNNILSFNFNINSAIKKSNV